MGEKVCERYRRNAGDHITRCRHTEDWNAQHDEAENIHLFSAGHQRVGDSGDRDGHVIGYGEDILQRSARPQAYK